MDLPDRAEAKSWQGRDVVDRDGEPLGRCHGVFADTDTGLPEWVLVDVGDRQAFVPAGDAQQEGDRVQVRFARAQVMSAPDVGDVTQLAEEDEKKLYTHYGVEFSTSDSGSVLPADAEPARTEPAETSSVPAPAATPSAERPSQPSPSVTPAAWAPREVPASGSSSGGSSAAPLAAVAGVVATVWLGLRERDRRARKRGSLSARSSGLRRQLAAGSAVVAEITQQAAERTQAAASGAAASTAEATRAGRSASRAAGRSAARAASRTSVETARRTAQQRRQLSRKASGAGSALTGGSRQLAQTTARAATGAGSAVSDTSRQLAHVASAAGNAVSGSSRQLAHAANTAGSAVTDSTRQLAGSVAAVPVRAARRGRKVKRSLGRVLWDAVLAAAAGAGYVAGARAGRERYDEIVELATRTAEKPEVRRVAETVTTTVTDPERRAQATGALLEKVRPITG